MRHSRQLQEETGAILILVALLMVALLGIAALVIDLGGLYGHDRELQTAADAAALAGATELIVSQGSQTQARDEANSYITKNVAESRVDDGNVTREIAVDATSVTVDLEETNVPFFFATVLGRDTGTVHAHAKAEVKFLTSINTLFPVAINYMNPDKFRFVFRASGQGNSTGETVHTFDLTDPNDDGFFDTVTEGGAPSFSAPGTYTVSLQSLAVGDSGDSLVAELTDIGLYYVSGAEDTLQRVGMSKTDADDPTVTVRVQTSEDLGDSLNATLGKGSNSFTLYRDSDVSSPATYTGSVSAPTGTGNLGYGVHDLKLTGNGLPNGAVARYVAWHPDSPLRHLMMAPSFYDGYSAVAEESVNLGAVIRTIVLNIGDEYTMKLGNNEGAGVYAGNWRIADIYSNQNTADEIAETDPGVIDSWSLNIDPLEIGGDLLPEGGAKVGQILNGLDERIDQDDPHPDDPEQGDPNRMVYIPIVEFTPLHGTSDPYQIAGFAAFWITDWSDAGPTKGNILGKFVRWAAAGEWEHEPSGNLYVETAVLTE